MKRAAFRVTWHAMVVLVLGLAAYGQNKPATPHYGLPSGWSNRYVGSHARISDSNFEQAALSNPTLLYNWILRQPHPMGRPRVKLPRQRMEQVDWHFPLGSGTIPLGMFPAKYSFNINQTPSCSADIVIYGLDVQGSLTQPNLVGLNNLYVNAGGTGACAGTAPSVAFAYNLTTVGNGAIRTSPSFSMDGTKIAFIETVTSGSGTVGGQTCTAPCSIFHVLTLGTTGSNGTFLANSYASPAPGVGNNASMTSLVFSNSGDTRSSAFIDYANDVAYFGDDNGNVYKTTCVFASGCTPALAAGYSKGAGIAVVSSGTNKILTAPIVDTSANKMFVGASDGNVYIVNLANCSGSPVTCTGTASLAVGRAAGAVPCFAGYAGVVDPPFLDNSFQIWYATSACSVASSGGIAVEGNYAGASLSTVAMGSPTYNLRDGMPDDNYFNTSAGATSVGGNLYFAGANSSKQLVLVGVTMVPKNGAGTALGTSNPPVFSTSTAVTVPGKGVSEASPITIIQNGAASDWLFFGQVSVPKNNCANAGSAEGCVFSYNVFNSSGVSTVPAGNTALASEAGGTSGIVMDNISASAGASSIYFANQSTTTTSVAAVCTTGASTPAFCAVKLTQAALQ